MPAPNFSELFLTHSGNKSSKWVHYLEIYERYFSRFRDTPCRILEIGVQNGGSLQLYDKYFRLAERIVGVDVDPQCAAASAGKIVIEIGSQADTDFLLRVSDTHGPFDLVIDDGSHVFDHQIASFEALFPLMAESAVYIVEDAHSSYLPSFGGGLRVRNTFIEYAKRLLDQVNAAYLADREREEPFATELQSVSFYDSIVVFEKSERASPFSITVGSMGHVPTPIHQDLSHFKKKHSLG